VDDPDHGATTAAIAATIAASPKFARNVPSMPFANTGGTDAFEIHDIVTIAIITAIREHFVHAAPLS
jgi:hypothetical protein